LHELAICQALVQQLTAIASEHPGNDIHEVHLSIGPLSGVVPELLTDAFPIASAGTAADGARLNISESEIRVRCKTCGEESRASMNKLVCGCCGDWQTELVSGDELLLQRVELEQTTQQPDAVH
jgi:hydrogenase nickel incorporation protein HypA/HybF